MGQDLESRVWDLALSLCFKLMILGIIGIMAERDKEENPVKRWFSQLAHGEHGKKASDTNLETPSNQTCLYNLLP